MLPFCGYNMGDYFRHWLDIGKKIPNPPKIFNVNWFRTDDKGNFIWPGFGDNMRVLLWILDRCEDKVGAEKSPIGYIPKVEDINIEGLDGVTKDTVADLLKVDKDLWKTEAAGIKEFYAAFDRLPDELNTELGKLENALK